MKKLYKNTLAALSIGLSCASALAQWAGSTMPVPTQSSYVIAVPSKKIVSDPRHLWKAGMERYMASESCRLLKVKCTFVTTDVFATENDLAQRLPDIVAGTPKFDVVFYGRNRKSPDPAIDQTFLDVTEFVKESFYHRAVETYLDHKKPYPFALRVGVQGATMEKVGRAFCERIRAKDCRITNIDDYDRLDALYEKGDLDIKFGEDFRFKQSILQLLFVRNDPRPQVAPETMLPPEVEEELERLSGHGHDDHDHSPAPANKSSKHKH